MAGLLGRLFGEEIDQEELFALQWKVPSSISVFITRDPNGTYVAKVESSAHYFKRPIVTQGATGQELFEMVNDAVLTVIDIPESYRKSIGAFLPPDEVRNEMSITIPDRYLGTKIPAHRA